MPKEEVVPAVVFALSQGFFLFFFLWSVSAKLNQGKQSEYLPGTGSEASCAQTERHVRTVGQAGQHNEKQTGRCKEKKATRTQDK